MSSLVVVIMWHPTSGYLRSFGNWKTNAHTIHKSKIELLNLTVLTLPIFRKYHVGGCFFRYFIKKLPIPTIFSAKNTLKQVTIEERKYAKNIAANAACVTRAALDKRTSEASSLVQRIGLVVRWGIWNSVARTSADINYWCWITYQCSRDFRQPKQKYNKITDVQLLTSAPLATNPLFKSRFRNCCFVFFTSRESNKR